MTQRYLAFVKKKLKGEPGGLLQSLVSWSEEPWLADHLLLDGEDAVIPPAFRKTPLHFLGRTGTGLFGVERTSKVFPVDARPVFFARFEAREVVRVADDLRAFLLNHDSLAEARPELARRVRSAAAPSAVTERPSPALEKKQKPLTQDDVQSAATAALKALGPAVGLVFALEEVALERKKKSAKVTICVQLPRSVELVALYAHPLSRQVLAVVTKSAEALGLSCEAQFLVEPVDADPISHLVPVVRRCSAPEEVVAFLESFRG